jgi:hypothetical protein
LRKKFSSSYRYRCLNAIYLFKKLSNRFIVFDDLPPVNAQQSRGGMSPDMQGSAILPLKRLVEDEFLEESLPLFGGEKGDSPGGILHVKVFWYEGASYTKPREDDRLMTKNWHQEMTLEIARSLKSKYLNLQNSFMIFDKDLDGFINFNDFDYTLKGNVF